MAQSVFINVKVDGHASTANAANHNHVAMPGASASGDVTVSFDPTTVLTRSRLRFAIQTALAQIEAGAGALKP